MHNTRSQTRAVGRVWEGRAVLDQELQWDGQNWYRWDGHDWVVDATVPPPAGGGASPLPPTVPGANLDWQVPAAADGEPDASSTTNRTRILAGAAVAVVALSAIAAGAFFLKGDGQTPTPANEGPAQAAMEPEPTQVIALPRGADRPLLPAPAKPRQQAKDGYFYGVSGEYKEKCALPDSTQTVVTLPYDTWVTLNQEPAVIQAGNEVRIDDLGIPVFACSENVALAAVRTPSGALDFNRPADWTGGTYTPVQLKPAEIRHSTWILRSPDGQQFQRTAGSNEDEEVSTTPAVESGEPETMGS